MTTLILESGSYEAGRRCDEKCYNARLPACECVCNGANHGAGRSKAISNTREVAEELTDKLGYVVTLPLME